MLIRIIFITLLWTVFIGFTTYRIQKFMPKVSRCTKEIRVYVTEVVQIEKVGTFYKPIFEAFKGDKKIIIKSAIPNNVCKYTVGSEEILKVNPENYNEFISDNGLNSLKLLTLITMLQAFIMMIISFTILYV